jgi:hypothetical protein
VSRGEWPGGDQSSARRVDGQVQPFERARAEQEQIALVGLHHLVDGEEAVEGSAATDRREMLSGLLGALTLGGDPA